MNIIQWRWATSSTNCDPLAGEELEELSLVSCSCTPRYAFNVRCNGPNEVETKRLKGGTSHNWKIIGSGLEGLISWNSTRASQQHTKIKQLVRACTWFNQNRVQLKNASQKWLEDMWDTLKNYLTLCLEPLYAVGVVVCEHKLQLILV